ncbi:hypothetical protein FHS51_004200 [Sphingobium wenxiniae]|nr:hypothetical protein [Sphingobium wenxiniae]
MRKHLAERGDQFTGHVGLGDIGSAVRQFACTWSHAARGNEDRHGRPSVADGSGQGKAGHPSGHFNIGEHRANVIAAVKDRQSVRRLAGLTSSFVR